MVGSKESFAVNTTIIAVLLSSVAVMHALHIEELPKMFVAFWLLKNHQFFFLGFFVENCYYFKCSMNGFFFGNGSTWTDDLGFFFTH